MYLPPFQSLMVFSPLLIQLCHFQYHPIAIKLSLCTSLFPTFKHLPNSFVGLGSFSGLRVSMHARAETFCLTFQFKKFAKRYRSWGTDLVIENIFYDLLYRVSQKIPDRIFASTTYHPWWFLSSSSPPILPWTPWIPPSPPCKKRARQSKPSGHLQVGLLWK